MYKNGKDDVKFIQIKVAEIGRAMVKPGDERQGGIGNSFGSHRRYCGDCRHNLEKEQWEVRYINV